jgi:hypothetical protein
MKRSCLPAAVAIGVLLLAAGCASKANTPAAPESAPAAGPAASAAARSGAVPAADPSLKQLDKFVGTWSMKGHLAGSEQETIIGEAAFHWLDGGYFMVQEVAMDFAGTRKIKSLELIGYDPESRTLRSSVYSNQSPVPLPYTWDIQGNTLTISVSYGALNATFKGTFSEDGTSFAGSWRPNPGADEKVNVAYDVGGTRIK